MISVSKRANNKIIQEWCTYIELLFEWKFSGKYEKVLSALNTLC